MFFNSVNKLRHPKYLISVFGLFLIVVSVVYIWVRTSRDTYIYVWKPEFEELNGPKISATNKDLIKKLKKKFLFKPAERERFNEYRLANPFETDPSIGQAELIDIIFKTLRIDEPLFFIECGALDGETRSNTLFFERFRGWNGLLIEADPMNFERLTGKNRKAWSSLSCLSPKPYPMMVSFQQQENLGKISEYSAGLQKSNHVDAQCFPVATYLEALNISTVHYFSLDVEGDELAVLKTIPFDRYKVETLSVEFVHDVEGKEAIENFMEQNGYVALTELRHPSLLANDIIFARKKFLDAHFSPKKQKILTKVISHTADVLMQRFSSVVPFLPV